MELLAHVVYTLAFEEYHRIGAVQSGLHKTLGLPRSRGEAHLESGDMRAQARPVLRMLRAVFGAHGHAQYYRHLKYARAHRLPLGHLVEYLVARAADEVCVHQLDHCAAAAHRVTYRAADYGRFGYGRVEQTAVREHVGQSPVHRESAAPVAYVFAVCDQRAVLVTLVDQRLEYGVADVEHLHLGHCLAVRVKGKAGLAGYLLNARAVFLLGKHVAGAGLERVDLLV